MTVGTFALGVYRLAEVVRREASVSLFPLATCIALPMAWDGARNGQATLLMAGLVMIAIADAAARHWSRAAVWLAIGLAIKPLAAVVILLMGAIHRELRGRLLAGLAAVAVFPFLTQSPAYVAQQYAACLQSLQSTAHVGVTESWAQPFSVLSMAGLVIDERLQSLVRAVAAAGTLAICWRAQVRLTALRYSLYLYALAACYLMLFNPRTENNTYAMLGPALGLFFAEACLVRRRYGTALVLLLMAGGTVGSNQFGKWLLPDWKPVWLAPLMALGFTAYVLVQLVAEDLQPREAGTGGTEASGSRCRWPMRRRSQG